MTRQLINAWCRLTYRRPPGERAWDRAVHDAIPYLDDRRREDYLSDVERRDAHLRSMQDRYDDAKRRFVRYDRMSTVRLPQPQSGRAYYERGKAIADAQWYWRELVAAALLRLLDEGER